MTTHLVSGASRGIGKEFITQLLQRPDSTVIAALRTPSSAEPLESLPKAAGSKLLTVKIDSSSETDAKEAIAQLQKDHGITRLDVVIANAGITRDNTDAMSAIPSAFHDVMTTNVLGPLLLATATRDLLKQSSRPVFAVIGSVAGSIASQAQFVDFAFTSPMVPYGVSKAAVSYVVERMHLEEKWLLALNVHPGLVETETALSTLPPGFDRAAYGALTPETSVGQMLDLIGKASREREGGKLVRFDGEILPW
ncbi:hypothetical protein CAC42_6181 [Sphaceloma murrayae]|uniref:Norsolorinic acid ketoreductase n=1 Tax=Sphaceloma murrayae TaxID=2082308 RepID=A0A2K1QTG6_9PEZI|nr:hypothetical protein CAC42_6181 [Sphaceloma murrayae]